MLDWQVRSDKVEVRKHEKGDPRGANALQVGWVLSSQELLARKGYMASDVGLVAEARDDALEVL